MRERDEAGKQYKKTKKIPIKNDWDKDLELLSWDQFVEGAEIDFD